MRIASFNVNSIRTRIDHLLHYLEKEKPALVGLQEIKVVDEQFPVEPFGNLGYEVIQFGQKSYHGVAVITNLPVKEVQLGFDSDTDEDQKRFQRICLETEFGDLWVINGYFPQGESRKHPTKFPAKEKFYADLLNLLQKKHDPDQDKLVIMGDLNIAPTDLDIGIGEENAKRWLKTGKCSFLPEEREWLQRLIDWGLVDSFRHLHGQEKAMSWFDYRTNGFKDGRGLRIDQIWLTKSLEQHLCAAGIDYELRAMERPSDHCLIWADLAP